MGAADADAAKRHHSWNFNIDRFLNPIVPSPPWKHLPYPVARWFGYRKTKPKDTGNLMPVFWAFIGVFCAITIIEAVSQHIPSFESRHAPIIVGSFGAAAVLEFYAIESPLAQPRNAIGGQLVSAFTGICVARLFLLSDRFDEIYWYGGALACACATALMALTKTVHPPAGATALLAVVDKDIVNLGWFLLPVMALGCGIMCVVALIINNLERRFPVYWWTPEDLASTRPMFVRRKSVDAEKGDTAPEAKTNGEPSASSVEATESKQEESGENEAETKRHAGDLVIRPGQVIVPAHMYLTPEETQYLETLSRRL